MYLRCGKQEIQKKNIGGKPLEVDHLEDQGADGIILQKDAVYWYIQQRSVNYLVK
jgi:hypothetical protein